MTVLHRPPNVWLTAFTDADREKQLGDDAAAWSRVAGILMVVIAMGFLISAIGVIIALMV